MHNHNAASIANDAMENSTSDDTWDDIFNGMASAIDVQMAHSDFDLWDQMLFSNTDTLNGARALRSTVSRRLFRRRSRWGRYYGL